MSQAATATPSVEEARKIVAPLYDALNEPGKKDTGALLKQCAHDDYKSYHTNEEYLTRDQLAGVFAGLGQTIPDLKWDIMDLMVHGDRVIVRGKATGTPVAEFWGAPPTGKGFDTMAIDIFTIRDGKLAQAFHIENWIAALDQMKK